MSTAGVGGRITPWKNETLTSVAEVRAAQPVEEILCQLIAFLTIFLLTLALANTAIIPSLFAAKPSPITIQTIFYAGNALAAVLLILAIRSFCRILFPPQRVTLTNAQRKLLGLPVGVELASYSPTATDPGNDPSLIRANATAPSPMSPVRSTVPLLRPASAAASATVSSPYRGSPSFYQSPTASLSRSASSPFSASPFSTPDTLLRGSPLLLRSRTSDMVVLSEDAVNRLIDSADKDRERREITDASFQVQTPSPSLSKYRPSPRPTVRTGPAAAAQAGDVEAIETFGLALQVPEWTERMRRWLSTTIVQPLVRRIVDLEENGIQLLHPMLAPDKLNIPTQMQSNMWYTLGRAAPTNSTPVNQRAQEIMRVVTEVDKYLQVLGVTSRDYLISRLKTLAQGDVLPAYRWNGGAAWKDKEWSPELPTDAQIIIHLFCTFMDAFIPGLHIQITKDHQVAEDTKPFTSRYFILWPNSPDSNRDVALHQSQIHPPHFSVVHRESDKKNTLLAVAAGRNNLFHSLVLFLWLLKTRRDGYLGSNFLGSKGLDLLQVVT